MIQKKTLVLGASPNPMRFSHKMTKSLRRHHHEVVPLGFRKGKIEDTDILTGMPDIKHVHTVALYLGADRQKDFYDYIIRLNPRRIIFNPGTYNPELNELAKKNGIETVIDCSLVMLSKGIY